MPEILRAAQLATMTPGRPLIEDGAVVVHEHVILDAGPYADMKRGHAGPVRDLGDVTLAPATLNSHTHLEMTHLLGKTLSGQGFFAWVSSLIAQPLYTPDPVLVRQELLRLEQQGCAFVADISTRNAAQLAGILAASGLYFVSFQEAIGNDVPEDAAQLLHEVREVEECGRGVASVAGHALYSTGGPLLVAAKQVCRERGLPFSLHLAEHEEEDAILLTGKSPFLDLLRERGYFSDDRAGYEAPKMRPVPLAAKLGLLDEHTLCVHCVTVSDKDIASIAASRASVCLCPRSNAYIGCGTAPLRKFLDARVNVCLGTDGLCSNSDLDPYGELLFLAQRGDSGLDLAAALALVTTNPARFFGLEQTLGSLAPGRQARFSIVPQRLSDAFSHS